MNPVGGQQHLAMPKNMKIIPVASGKGGVGKSVLAANLAIALANLGHETIAVDLDLGGSNLHTYLGIPNTNPGVGDFLKGKRHHFADLVVKTGIPRLGFIPGDGKTPFMANIPSGERLHLMGELLSLPAEYLIVDLGAGTSFNTMNLFGMSHRGVIVTTFEHPSLMNFFFFLKNFMLANLTALVRSNRKVHAEILEMFRQPQLKGGLTFSGLISKVAASDKALAARIQEKCRRYRPRVVFNMGETPNELNVLAKIDAILRKNLSLEADYCGYIYHDDQVRKCARKNEVLLTTYPESLYGKCVNRVARRIVAGKNHHAMEAVRTLQVEAHQVRVKS
jgi:flagellar biosynthesis protein FlhG